MKEKNPNRIHLCHIITYGHTIFPFSFSVFPRMGMARDLILGSIQNIDEDSLGKIFVVTCHFDKLGNNLSPLILVV